MIPKALYRVAHNTTALLLSDITNRASTFIIYALVGRYLGIVAFSQLSLALTFFYIFQVCAIAGLRSFIVREVAKDKTTTSQYLLHGCIIVAAFSLGSFAMLALVVWLIGYPADTAFCIILISLGLFPIALAAVCESIIQAWEKMQYIAYVQIPIHIVKVLLGLLLLWQGYSLYPLLVLLLASSLAIAVMELGVVRCLLPRAPVRLNIRLCWNVIKAASTFLSIDIIIAIMGAVDILVLSKLGSARDVAFFNAARQLLVPMITVYLNLFMGIFPLLCRKHAANLRDLQELYEHIFEVLLFIALPVVISLFFLADDILALLYGEQFVPASAALRIMVWHLLLMPSAGLLGQVLVASKYEKTTLRIVAIDWLINGVCAVFLISAWGLLGATLSGLFTRIADVYLHGFFVSKLLAKLRVLRLAWKPAVASFCMLVALFGIGYQGKIIGILCAGIVYATVVLAMILWESGSVVQLKARYLSLWME